MGHDRNVLRLHKAQILNLKFNPIIDRMIAEEYVNEDLYQKIYSVSTNSKRLERLYEHFIDNEKLLVGFFKALKEENPSIYNEIEKDRDIVQKALAYGCVPILPPHHIERTDFVNQLGEKLEKLKDNGFLIVNGLAGMGKSSLVNDVLQNPEIIRKHNIFWITLGDLDNMDLFLSKLKRLHTMATKLAEINDDPPNGDDLDHWGYYLRTLFENDNLKSSLIILDDIKCPDIVEFFVKYPLGRFVATTQDTSVFRSMNLLSNHNQLKIGGFTQQETLKLLKSALDTEELPKHFAEAYGLCHGSPILTRQLCTFLIEYKDLALGNVAFFKQLFNSNVCEESQLVLDTAIKKNVENLSQSDRDFFHSFAIFPIHVNIDVDTIMLLWPKLTKAAIWNTMMKLRNKSLVTGYYDEPNRAQIYGIHGLVKNYLDFKIDDETMKNYHKILLDSFEKVDRESEAFKYLLAYYGHHLKGAELIDGFQKFLDIDFIREKLIHIGPSDLLSDFKTYHAEITKGDPTLEKWLKDMKRFITTYHWLIRHHSDTDIKQYMLYDKNYCFFPNVKKIVLSEEQSLFFDLEKDHEQVRVTGTIIEKNVTAVALTSSHSILIGKRDGLIEHKSFRQQFVIEDKFRRHSGPIDSIIYSQKSKHFTSLSKEENLVLYWSLLPLEEDPKSPKSKNANYRNLHHPHLRSNSVRIQMSDPITSLSISSHYGDQEEDLIYMGSQRGSVGTFSKNIYGSGGDRKHSVAVGHEIIDIVPISSEILTIMRDGSAPPSVKKFVRTSGTYFWQNEIIPAPVDGSILFFIARRSRHDVIVVGSNCFWSITDGGQNIVKIDLVGVKDDRITCGALTLDEANLVLGSEGLLYIYSMVENTVSRIRIESSFRVMSILIDDPEVVHFASYDGDTLRCHKLRLPPHDRRLVDNVGLYTCHWQDSIPIYPLVDDNNHVDIFMGRELIKTEIIHNGVTCLCFSHKNKMLVGCRNGTIWRFDTQSKKKAIELARFSGNTETVTKIKSFPANPSSTSITSSGSDGGVVIASTMCQILIKEIDLDPVIIDFEREPIDFTLIYNDIVVIVDSGSHVTSWTLQGNKITEICNEESSGLICVSFHDDLLAMTSRRKDDSYRLHVLRFEDKRKIESINDGLILYEPKCLAFSNSGTLLAVGFCNGLIQVLNLDKNKSVYLDLHEKPVTYLLFMPFAIPILISLSDNAAWWDLRDSHDTGSYQAGKTKNVKIWSTKVPTKLRPNLLSSLNFQGNRLQYVSVSTDLLTFLIIDSVRNVYKLQVIQND